MENSDNASITESQRELLLSQIGTIAKRLEEIEGIGTPKPFFSIFRSIDHYKSELTTIAKQPAPDAESLRKNALDLIQRSSRMMELTREFELEQQVMHQLNLLDRSIRKAAEIFIPNGEININDITQNDLNIPKIQAAIEILEQQLSAAQSDSNQVRKELTRNNHLYDELSKKLASADQLIADSISAALEGSSQILEDLKKKQEEVNELTGLVSGSTIANTYASSAEEELKSADQMRNISLLLMALIVGIVGYSLFETTLDDFDWRVGLLRIAFSITLSIPAAYLARESTKHRSQQHSHQRISLDLKAITPYLASLPSEDQHKLKIDIANRIFGSKAENVAPTESYPININEILLALVSKIERTSDKKAD